MMHTTNTVFKKIESTHLIFTLYKKETETETGGEGKTGQKAIKSFVLVLHQPVDYKLDAFGASTTLSKNPQQTNPTLQLRLNKQNKKP